MTTELMWPEWVLTPTRLTPLHSTAMTTSGGKSPTGSEQVVGNSPGRNRIVLGGVILRTPQQERIWRTIEQTLAGRSGVIMVPAFSRRTAPWPTLAQKQQVSISKIALTDDILFSNGAGLYSRTIVAEAASTIAAGDVSLDITVQSGSSLLVGQIFQAGEYAYTIRKIDAVDTDGDYPVFSVKFNLPAREAITSGDDLEFDNPRFRARLEADDGMALDLDMMRFGTGSPAFIEDV